MGILEKTDARKYISFMGSHATIAKIFPKGNQIKPKAQESRHRIKANDVTGAAKRLVSGEIREKLLKYAAVSGSVNTAAPKDVAAEANNADTVLVQKRDLIFFEYSFTK